jgi:glutamate dehydrogenase (NAD(P)+)
MVPEMPLMDLCHLARVMTLKYSFLKWPFGGAKAAILTHCDDPSPPQRRQSLESFARRLLPFRGWYLPGQDIGTNSDDLNLIRRIARLERLHRVPDSAYYTALTVRICIEHLAQEQRLQLAQGTAAIEGLGKVGGWVARQLSELGCRIIAVSTKKGALYQGDGLDVDGLLRAREAFGDDCVNKYEADRRIEREELLSLPTDFLIPCALSWSIRGTNAGEVRAKRIVCGANNAVTDSAKEVLAAKGITYFPDFVSNSGGVLGSTIEMLCMDRTRTVDLLRQQFEPKVSSVLTRARDTGRSTEAVARDIAMANHQEMKQRQVTMTSRLSALLARAYRHGLLPRQAVRLFAAAYVRRTMA